MKEFALNSVADVPGVLTFFAPQPQKKNFAPRIGFAYSPGTNGTTSIRGGFGMAYDQVFDNVGTNARPPQATSTVDAPVTETPGFLANGGIKPNAPGATLTPAQARAATSSYLPGNQQPGYCHQLELRRAARVRARTTRWKSAMWAPAAFTCSSSMQLNRAAVVTPTHSLPTYLTAPSQATLDACR